MEELIPEIVQRNRDIENIMFASCYFGVHGGGKRQMKKQFAMLVATDVHKCDAPLQRAVDYLNYYKAIDCGIVLGDFQPSNFAETDGTWYADKLLQSKKPFLTVLGNHDVGNSTKGSISGSSQMAFDKFLRATAPVTGLEDYNKTYFVKLFEQYRVAIICLDMYDSPLNKDDNGDYIIHRGTECLSQEQVDWFIDTLLKIPEGYHTVVALHSYPAKVEPVACPWTDIHHEYGLPRGDGVYGNNNILSDIVDAWVNGTKLSCEYAPTVHGDICPVLRAECDFTGRGEGVFAAFLMGHWHRDLHLKSAKYPYQSIIGFASSANDTWQNYCCDLPRELDTKSEDALTVMSVCTNIREIRLVRVGSNFTVDMTPRVYYTVKY